jgi:thioesterase domain-containing protein/aryl carrier-like protein
VFNCPKNIHIAHIIIRNDEGTEKTINAFIVLEHACKDEGMFIENVYTALKQSLPNYMIPSSINIITALPLTANGKIDRQKLHKIKPNMALVNYQAACNKTEKLLISVLSEVLALDTKRISMHDNFFDIGGNSLSLIQVINKLKNHSLAIDIKHFYENHSLLDVLQARLQQTPKALINLNKNKTETPLYIVHPIGGRVDCYNELAARLKDVCPVVGIQAPFTFADEFQFETIPQLAEYYVQAIMSDQPTGPYRVGGWSVGGMVAQHIIRNLINKGETVEYFVALDSFMIMPYEHIDKELDALKKIIAFIKGDDEFDDRFFQQDVSELPIEEILDLSVDIISQQNADDNEKTLLLNGLRFGMNFVKAQVELHPQTVQKSVLFIAEENDDRQLMLDGWNKGICSETDFIEVQGRHLHMLEGQSLDAIVDKLTLDIKAL